MTGWAFYNHVLAQLTQIAQRVNLQNKTWIDCGYDDRTNNHSHVWLASRDIASYCNELQTELKILKQKMQLLLDEVNR
jgi:hypothetical protein